MNFFLRDFEEKKLNTIKNIFPESQDLDLLLLVLGKLAGYLQTQVYLNILFKGC